MNISRGLFLNYNLVCATRYFVMGFPAFKEQCENHGRGVELLSISQQLPEGKMENQNSASRERE